MASSNTYGILEHDWNIRDYLNQFVNFHDIELIARHVDKKILALKDEFDIDFKKAQAEYRAYLSDSIQVDFRRSELEIKKANFPKRISEWEKNKSQTDSDLNKYISMAQQVKDLNLNENKALNDLMLSQIKQSIVFDCRHYEKPKVGDDYNIDEYISWQINHLWFGLSNMLKRYNRKRAKLLRDKYQAIELLDVFAKL